MTEQSSSEDPQNMVTRPRVAIVSEDPTSMKQRRLVQFLWGAAALVMAISVAWVVILLTVRYTALVGDNSALQEQNIELQNSLDELQDAQTLNNESLDCFNLYTNRIAEASFDFQSAEGRVFTLIMRRLTIEDPAARPPISTLTDAAEEVDATNGLWKDALDERRAWVEEGSPLPCPINSEGVVD